MAAAGAIRNCRNGRGPVVLTDVTLALLRSWLVAALPAVLALVAVVTVSTWSSADRHHEGEMAAAHAIELAQPSADVGVMVHVAAHAIGHGMNMPQPAPAPRALLAMRPTWRVVAAALPPGVALPSPTRPPRA